MSLPYLLQHWGYLAVAIGAFLEGEGVLLTAGVAAHRAALSLPLVVLAGAAGSFVWGQTWFQVGRASGQALLTRRPAWRPKAARIERWLTGSGVALLLGGRFLVGFGTALPTLIGASGFSLRRFLLFDALGAALWSALFSGAGFVAGAGLERLFGHELGWVGLALSCLALLVALGIATRIVGLLLESDEGGAEELAAPSAPPLRQVIITGDDFGLAVPVNEAVELGYRRGVLTTTSLLVGEPAAQDAIERAQRNPGLCVGLHVSVCDGWPTLPAAQVPLLVDARGRLYGPVTAILRLLLLAPLPALRRQLEAEIRAQFEAFRATGLELDHVNGHNNMQLHPLVLPILLRVAREYGVSAMRLPYEPLLPAWRAAERRQLLARLAVWSVMGPWSAHVKQRLVRHGLLVNDYLFGIFDCGSMHRELLTGTIANLPVGLSEIHCHPATRRCPELDRDMPTFRNEAELAALIDPMTREALGRVGIVSSAGFAGVVRRAGTGSA